MSLLPWCGLSLFPACTSTPRPNARCLEAANKGADTIRDKNTLQRMSKEASRGRSEDDLERELCRARTAHLIQGTERPKALRQCCRGLAKRASRPSGTESRIYCAEVRMIEDVKSFGTEL